MIEIQLSQLKDLVLECGLLFGAATFFIQQLLALLFEIARLLIAWYKSRK